MGVGAEQKDREGRRPRRATSVYSESERDQSEGRALRPSDNPIDCSSGELHR
jgi:hypothetical protein